MRPVPSVAAIVVNWNLPDLTLACIAALRASLYPRLQIVLVDNGSTSGCLATLRRAAPDCTLLALPYNRGFAAAANAGIRHALAADADYILLVNNDAVAAPDMLALLVAEAQSDARAGIVAPLILYQDAPARIWRLGDRERAWLPIPRALWRDARVDAAPTQPLDVDYVTGCGMLVRRELIEQLGGFDERFTMYYEDADLCRRARQAGYRIRVVPVARLWHKVSQSARIDRPATALLWMRSRVLFYRSKATGLRRAVTEGFVLVTGLRDVLVAAIRGERQLALALLRGFAAGYTAR
jgi:GT2 family glycosyltransferase